jgi:phosphoribosylanthranilate isomerase
MWTKICGILDEQTARAVAKLGPDAIGLNFYGPSPRRVEISHAADIVNTVGSQVLPVGLFVNHSLVEIREICRQCQITTIQLHGDETPEFLSELSEFRILRAFRIGPAGLDPVFEYLEQCNWLKVPIWACLIDAAVPGQYGGSGVTVDWRRLAAEYSVESLPPLILAGGLTADNVTDAIQTVQPWGVDVASGVEVSRGVKDLGLVEKFIRATVR